MIALSDICISEFLDESRAKGKSVTVYFPSEFYDWMSSSDKKFQQLQLREKVEQLANGDDLQQFNTGASVHAQPLGLDLCGSCQ